MITVYDKDRKRKGLLENAFDIEETHAINDKYTFSFSLPREDVKNDLCQPFRYVRYNNGHLYRILPSADILAENGIKTYQCEHVKHVLLIENGFHSNGVDEAFLLKDENLNYIAEMQARIIANFLGVKLLPEAEAPAMPPQDAPAAASKIKFNLFGQKAVEISGSVINGVSFIAARELLEAMEFIVGWDSDLQTVNVSVPTLK